MKRYLVSILSLLFVVSMLVGCAQENTNSNENQQDQIENEETITITISTDNGAEVLAEEEIAIEEGAILLNVLKENFEIDETDGFITSIEGVSQDDDAGKYWMFDVNGEMAPVGANEFELSPDDEVVFDLQAME